MDTGIRGHAKRILVIARGSSHAASVIGGVMEE
jgi:hypothetical protein